MLSLGYAQYPVKEKNGKITGVVTKTEVLNKLVKQRVNGTDPIRNLVQRELRHVSLRTPLSELGRVLTRNRFVLVDRQFMCTSTDLLGHLAVCKNMKSAEPVPIEVESLKQTPGEIVDSISEESENNMGMKLAASAICGMGIASAATFMFMKSQQV